MARSMTRHRVLAIGIDALDPNLLMEWRAYLPNFMRLKEIGGLSRVCSTFPADSVPAWTTIYTGLSPADHGILDETEYLDFKAGVRSKYADILKGSTFWDRAGAHGLRICIINPFLAYPVWPVNGVMVSGPVFVTGEAQSFPDEIKHRWPLPELGGMVDFPSRRELPAFIERSRKVTKEQFEYGLLLWNQEAWDLFFICILTLDRVQHFLWRYQDKSDPTYPGETALSKALREFYVLLDSLIGELLNHVEPDAIVVIFSDHGHGMRPPRQVYVNEWLRRNGLLESASTGPIFIRPEFYIERIKRFILSSLYRLDMEDLTYWLAHWIPKKHRKILKQSSYATSRGNSLAYLSSLGSGTPTGAIHVNRTQIIASGLSVERIEQTIIDGLMNFADPVTKQKVFKWIRRREEFLSGAHVSIFPELLFEMEANYAGESSQYLGLVGTSPVHRKMSGGHNSYGTFIINRASDDLGEIRLPTNISEIRPLLLRLLDI